MNIVIPNVSRKELNKIPRDQVLVFMYLLFVLAVCALSGCGMSGIEAGFASELPGERPLDKIFLGSITLELFGASDRHPSVISFSRDGKELLKETAKAQEKLAIISIPVGDDNGRILTSTYLPRIDSSSDEESLPAASKARIRLSGSDGRIHPATGARKGVIGKQNFLFNLAADGVPAVVVERQKVNGTFDYEVFRLSKKIEKIATISNGYSRIQMQTTDLPGCYEIMANDCYSGLSSRTVAPEVLLMYRNGALKLDTVAMTKPAPDKKQLALLRKSIRTQFNKVETDKRDNCVPAELAAEVLDLYYSGNATQARRFFDSAWLGTSAGKEKYWENLMTEARHSPYWTDVLAMNQIVQK